MSSLRPDGPAADWAALYIRIRYNLATCGQLVIGNIMFVKDRLHVLTTNE